jgi:hypothetical protein
MQVRFMILGIYVTIFCHSSMQKLLSFHINRLQVKLLQACCKQLFQKMLYFQVTRTLGIPYSPDLWLTEELCNSGVQVKQ